MLLFPLILPAEPSLQHPCNGLKVSRTSRFAADFDISGKKVQRRTQNCAFSAHRTGDRAYFQRERDIYSQRGFEPSRSAPESPFSADIRIPARPTISRNVPLVFLHDLLSCHSQVSANHYGPPVILLAAGRGDWFVRANIWPAAHDSVMTASGPGPFFYGVPHDHNFSFLTVGYLGPGYESDYWEYDHASVAGYPGEPVALRPIGRHRLGEGRVMLYRAHRDVHRQHPPASLSVTINIMENGPRQPWLDQYRFDPARGTIAGLLNPLATAVLLPLVAQADDGEGAALLAETARRHPSDRLRLAAIDAAAGAAPTLAARIAILSAGTASPSAQVRGGCRERLRVLARTAAWIAGDPSEADQPPAVPVATAA